MKIFLMKFRSIAILFALLLPLAANAQYDKDVFSFRGRAALQDGRLSEAVSNFNILAQLDSTDYWTFFYRGIAKYNLGDIRGAKADFSNGEPDRQLRRRPPGPGAGHQTQARLFRPVFYAWGHLLPEPSV